MNEVKITVVADNVAPEGWTGEHGLALALDFPSERVLFDTGAGRALLPNLRKAGIDPGSVRKIILSHGHNDHTGGLAEALKFAPNAEIFGGENIIVTRYSIHPGRPCPVKNISMPFIPEKPLRIVRVFTRVTPEFFLTGAIKRLSFEDCGGPFYFDREGKAPDTIADEIALLTANGVLVQGCCHAGIINTLEHCRRHAPLVTVRTIIGGLHLTDATETRLKKTAEYLNRFKPQKLILLHCTGENAADYLKKHLRCVVAAGRAGDVYVL